MTPERKAIEGILAYFNSGNALPVEKATIRGDSPEVQALRAALEQPAVEQDAWKGLSDVQWMNIVNANDAWRGYTVDDAVHEVVKLTESRLKTNNTAPQAQQPAVGSLVERDAAYKEAKYLAEALFKKHYAQDACYASGDVEWGLCDSTAGIISQIDNMVCQLVRSPADVPLLTDEEIKDAVRHLTHSIDEFRAIEQLVRQKAGLK